MKILKKMLSVFMAAVIIVSTLCVGTVSVGAAESDYSITLDGSSEEFSIYLKAPSSTELCKAYSDKSMYFVLIFTCGKEKLAIVTSVVGSMVPDDVYGIYSSGSWQTAPTVYPSGRSTSVGYDYESWQSATGLDPFDFKAEFVIRDKEINKLLINCSKVELGFENYGDNTTFDPKLETIYTKNSSKTSISSLKISDLKSYTYTGKNRKASVTIMDGDYTLKKGTDYTLTYKNCKNIGTASVTIKGKGDYTGSKTLTYKIVPKKTTLKASKKSDTKVKLSWTEVSGAERYQIYYSTNGGKYKKLTTISGSKTSATISKLDFEKNDYKFKIRSYKTVDGKKYYSSYSKVVTVK